ncbi:STE3-like pheromone receptor [Amylostereum chailletii]|nr:STE3-like pheromone receptor [Amylostereum chailletii]
MVDSAYPLFPIAAFIGFAVALIPLSWHASAWNAGTCMYMFWVSTTCLAEFINAIVWKGNLLNPAPIWCDITAKLFVGAGVGLPAASLCINRRLFNITSGKTVFITRADRFRTMMEDLAVSAGIPFLVMVLHIVVQGHRFNILEDVGCASVTFNTLPAYFLVFMWPVLLGSISFIYAGLTLRRFIVHRAEVTGVITNHAFLNVNRYFRLMVFATIDMMAVVPISVFNIYIGTKGVDLAPWISWADTHFDFQRVEFIPAIVWKTDGAFFISVEMGRWVYPLSSIVFFGVFGFTAEARKSYRRITYWFARQVGWTRLADVVSTTRPSPLP